MHSTANNIIGIKFYVFTYDICELISGLQSDNNANATWSQ